MHKVFRTAPPSPIERNFGGNFKKSASFRNLGLRNFFPSPPTRCQVSPYDKYNEIVEIYRIRHEKVKILT